MAWRIFRLFDVAWVYQAPNQLKDQDQLTFRGLSSSWRGIVNGLWDTPAVEYI